jgi:ABC-type dipeptide/oligopeptide/nickel transport system permease subunit
MILLASLLFLIIGVLVGFALGMQGLDTDELFEKKRKKKK